MDILTGEKRIVRTDIMEDTGLSTSPIVGFITIFSPPISIHRLTWARWREHLSWVWACGPGKYKKKSVI